MVELIDEGGALADRVGPDWPDAEGVVVEPLGLRLERREPAHQLLGRVGDGREAALHGALEELPPEPGALLGGPRHERVGDGVAAAQPIANERDVGIVGRDLDAEEAT